MLKKILKVVSIVLIVLILGMVVLISCGEDVTHSEEDIQSVVDNASTYTYEELSRNEDLEGCAIKCSGEVIQEGDGWYRVALGNDYDHIAVVDYIIGEGEDRIMEDDHITIYGVCQGLETYETILGEEVTVPEIDGYKVVVNK